MRVLILGGYGFIGAEIMRACAKAGFACVGLGRHAATGKRLVPDSEWIGADMARLDSAEKWAPHLSGVDAIVNAAGALQDGARDNLDAIHHRSIAALIQAAERANVKMFIQISAPGASASASTAFLRTKAAGDSCVRAANLDWIVFKPGLVIGRGAYGGTALLRLLAGLPLMTPLVYASARVQTAALDDVSAAVVSGLRGEIPMRRDYDLVEDAPRPLRDIVRDFRRQLGFAPARFEPDLPPFAAAPVSALADIAGLFGWRSALRSTAMRVMSANVLGDPTPWKTVTGRPLKSLDETLQGLPSTAQERLYARAQLALPILIVMLGLFWIASGLIGLVSREAAAAHLQPVVGATSALAFVVLGSIVDIAIGAGLLLRTTARPAAVASIAVAVFYLAAGTLTAPALWLDPFGVLTKVFPVIAGGAAVALLLEER